MEKKLHQTEESGAFAEEMDRLVQQYERYTPKEIGKLFYYDKIDGVSMTDNCKRTIIAYLVAELNFYNLYGFLGDAQQLAHKIKNRSRTTPEIREEVAKKLSMAEVNYADGRTKYQESLHKFEALLSEELKTNRAANKDAIKLIQKYQRDIRNQLKVVQFKELVEANTCIKLTDERASFTYQDDNISLSIGDKISCRNIKAARWYNTRSFNLDDLLNFLPSKYWQAILRQRQIDSVFD